MDDFTLRHLASPRRTRLRRGLAAALTLALAGPVGAQQAQGLTDEQLEAAAELCAPDLAERMLADDTPPDFVRELLALLEPHLDGADERVSRTLLCGCTALERFLSARGADFPEENLRLQELRVRAHWARGEGAQAAKVAYPLSTHLRMRGEFLHASDLLEQSLALLEPLSATRPWLLLALAEIDRHFSQLERARDRLDEADAGLAPGFEHDTLRQAIGGLRAQVLLDLGLVDLAAPWIEAEIEDLRERRLRGEDVSDAMPAACVRLADLRLASGLYELVIVDLELALQDLAGLPDPEGRIALARQQLELRLALARLEVPRSRPADVDRALHRLESIHGDDVTDQGTRLACACRLAQWFLRIGDRAGAKEWLGRARVGVGGEGAAGAERDLGNLAFLSALETRLSILDGDEREVQEQHLARLERDFERLSRQWLAQPPRVAGLGFMRYDRTRTILGELLAGQVALAADPGQGSVRALATLQRANAAGSLHRLLEVEPADLGEVQSKLLPAGTGALVYLPYRDRSLVFTIDAEHGPEVYFFEGERALEALVRSWKDDILTSPAELSPEERKLRQARIARRGADLSARLLPAAVIERVRSWESILIVGSDLLGELPFEALPLGGQGALGLVKSVSYLPSLPLGVHLHDRALAREEAVATDLCLVADVRIGPGRDGLERLPFGSLELERLLAPFHRERVTALLGDRATLAELRRQDFARTAVLHFVTHGADDVSRERPQGLVLSGSETLWSEDAESWRGGPRLVVLTACGAGRGPQRKGDGPVAHLGGAFLRGGVDCVVLSDAQLAYRPSLLLMGAFQRELARGAAPAEALRRSRVEVSRSAGGDDPFYYALVRVLGLGNRPVF